MVRLVPCLVRLFWEFDVCWPDRTHGSDGWIGDPAHQARDSDHNPDSRGLVHAIDVDSDLGSPMGDVVRHLVARRDRRLTYIIHARTIWSASHGWQPRPYRGDNPHIEHAHFSASDEPHLENDIRSFHLEEVPVALTEQDIDRIARAVWDHKLRNPYSNVDQPAGTILRYVPSRSPHEQTQKALAELAATVAAIEAKLSPPA